MRNTIFLVQSLKKTCFEYPNQARKVHVEISLNKYYIERNIGVINVKFAFLAITFVISIQKFMIIFYFHFENVKNTYRELLMFLSPSLKKTENICLRLAYGKRKAKQLNEKQHLSVLACLRIIDSVKHFR